MARPRNNETRELILKNAYNRFLSDRYESVYLKDIAKDTGITATLLHHYYPTKADIVIHIIYDMLIKIRKYLIEVGGEVQSQAESYSYALDDILYMFDVLLRNNGAMLDVYSYVLCDTKLMNEVVEFCCDKMAPKYIVDTVEKRYNQFILWGGISQVIALYLKKRLPHEVRDGIIKLYNQYLLSNGITEAERSQIIETAKELSTKEKLDAFYKQYEKSIDHFINCEW